MAEADIVFLYVTCPTLTEAETLAEAVVGQRLAACANILPGMRSVYWWQGKLEKADEIVLIFKTQANLVEAATAAIKAAHSYTVPCVLPLPVLPGGNPDYRAWLAEQTQ
ncbi:divalent-cation tolerance protein CutA [Ferrovibrio sp. MS7]|uniref:divalent-cation tolerance protein CutA n=1 Tax=Ferrovibrio plantarum TaxID=3119164 RepID=UPI003135C10A